MRQIPHDVPMDRAGIRDSFLRRAVKPRFLAQSRV